MRTSMTVARSDKSDSKVALGMSPNHLRTLAARLGKLTLALIGVSLVMAMPARAQSLKDLENQLYKKEQFFQPVNATRQVAERFGLKFTKTEDGEFMHAAVTHVIDGDGVLRAKFHGLNFD